MAAPAPDFKDQCGESSRRCRAPARAAQRQAWLRRQAAKREGETARIRQASRRGARRSSSTRSRHLDLYLEDYERKVDRERRASAFCSNGSDARDIILKLCREADAKLVTKGKSMVSEEIGLNACLEAAGIEAVETDLGEYIVQIRGETPSHLIAPDHPSEQGRPSRRISAACTCRSRRGPDA